MKKLTVARTLTLIFFANVNMTAAQGYIQCEQYEFAELKNLTQKQLQTEFCKVETRTNDIYRAIGYASVDGIPTSQLIRDRNNCWQQGEKIGRQPRFKNVSTDCAGLVRVTPIDAALERSKQKIKEMDEKLKEMKEN